MGVERLIAGRLLGRAIETEAVDLAAARLSEEVMITMGRDTALARLGQGAVTRAVEEKALGALVPDAAEKVLVHATGTSTKEAAIIKFNPRAYIGEGDEGKIFSNGDGTVTKVFHSADEDLNKITGMYSRLDEMGVRVPKIFEAGRTAEGQPALRIEQIGDGEHLQNQLMLSEIPRAEMPAIREQYDAMAATVHANNVRIDWQLRNMRWENGKLYMLDPSFLKEEPMGDAIVAHMRRGLGG